jgi:hypothetical protein
LKRRRERLRGRRSGRKNAFEMLRMRRDARSGKHGAKQNVRLRGTGNAIVTVIGTRKGRKNGTGIAIEIENVIWIDTGVQIAIGGLEMTVADMRLRKIQAIQ